MSETILKEALERLPDPRYRFVFPSEIAATSTLAAVLSASGRRALPARRFIGWDAFKSEVFQGDPDGHPSTKAVRSIFARLLLADNAAQPFLRSVVPPEAAAVSARWAPSIASALPALRTVPDGAGALLEDWRGIRRRYAAFMEAAGLYEASWLGRTASASGDRWVLFYPDLTEDWDDYERAVRAIDGITIIDAEGLDCSPVPASRFATVVEEARAVMLRIREEIASGTDPAGIAISIASPEASLRILEREAAVAGIPLDRREGRPLSESAGGRLVEDIIELSRSRMSFESMRRLLLDRSRPWNDDRTARRLIQLGIRNHIVAPLPDGPDVWESSIGADADLRRLYRGLRTSATKIADATGFRPLKSAFEAFKMAFLDASRWSPQADDEIARCVAVLDELDAAALTAGVDPNAIPGAADAYLEALRTTRYLPVSEAAGIPVYRFPVAAGARPALHFVMNLAEGDASAASRPLSYMRADERDKAGAVDRDLSAALIRLLAASGDRVFMSYSEDGPEGVRPPHPAIAPRDPAALGLPYDRERWLPNNESMTRAQGRVARGSDAGGEAFPVQVACAKAALRTVFGPDGVPWSTGTPESPAIMGAGKAGEVRATLLRDGVLALSVTAMEGYASCAFRRIFAGHLGAVAVDSGLSFIDARLTGQVYHDAFKRLFRPLEEKSQPVLAGDGDASGTLARPGTPEITAAIRSAIDATGRELGAMAGTLVATAAPVLERNFTAAAGELLRALDGLVPVMVDSAELYAPLKSVEAKLYGRPDLVCVGERAEGSAQGSPLGGAPRVSPGSASRVVIVDYKKSRVPAAEDLAPDEDGRIAAIQIPVYTELVKAAGYEPGSAWYVSVEGYGSRSKRLLLVYGPYNDPAISADMMGLLAPAVESAAAQAARTIDSGEVFVPARADRKTICDRCELKPVCRVHYTVR
jgi:hypothetical protein